MVLNQRNSTELSSGMSLLSRNIVYNVLRNKTLTRNLVAGINNRASSIPLTDQNVRNFATEEQENLLRFPANKLKHCMDMLYTSAKPFLSCEEKEESKKDICLFLNGIGGILQKHLDDTADKERNWLAERWLKSAYLQYRDPVLIHSNPGMCFPPQCFNDECDMLKFAAKTIYCLAKYKKIIDNRDIPILKMGKLELDNSQFHKIFGTCRIPGIKEDTMSYNPDSQHVVIIYRNNFFKLPVYSGCKPLHPIDVLYPQLRKIVYLNCNWGPKVGLLSADNRDNWAKAYNALMTSAINQLSIKAIQTALFTVSLDKKVPIKKGCNDMVVTAEQCIHGGGSCDNSANRWFDKTIQFIINPNGVNGICYEHAPAEGGLISALTDYMTENLPNEEFYDDACCANCPADDYCPLEIEVSPKVQKYIEIAEKNVDKQVENFEVNVAHFRTFGAEYIKKKKLGPDSFIQTAIQLAFYNLHKKPAPHYESGHLRIFAGGRTETIRSCTPEVYEFCEMMSSDDIDPACAEGALREAVASHRAYTTLALTGKAIDRHLLGLKLMAKEHSIPLPNFFQSPVVTKSSKWLISTSQVPSKYEALMAYGTLHPDGYGCCYSPRKKDIFFGVSAWKNSEKSDALKFSKSLMKALESMQKVLEGVVEVKCKL